MSHLQRIRSRPVAIAGACGILIVAATAADAARAASLTLESGVPTFSVVDLGASGHSAGDLNVFQSSVSPAGRLLGIQTTLALTSDTQIVQGVLTFDLPEGQIAVSGVSRLDPQTTGLLTGQAFTRAVVGGTGAYAGARGEVVSTRRPDGSYDQRFTFDAPPKGGRRSLTVYSRTPGPRTLDLGAPGASAGDESIVDAGTLVDAGGTRVGSIRGLETTILTDDGQRVVLAQATFRLPGGDIVIGGVSGHVADGSGNVPGVAYVRPVLGGTGAYAGATGTVTTTRVADGRYEQRFALSGLGQRVTRTLRLTGASGPSVNADLPPAGVSGGDMTLFDVPMRRGRRTVGRARGVQTSIVVEHGHQTVSTQITYVLRRGSLVVAGLSDYPAAGTTGTVRNRPQVRAVIGGTGVYAGAHGTVRAVRQRDGTYRQTFSLSGAPSRKR
jgi:hypothetical protein